MVNVSVAQIPVSTTYNLPSVTITETVIGKTRYDFQSNNGMPRRIVNNGNATLSAVWGFRPINTSSPFDRGTGYNFYDGVNWLPLPSVRIENVRTGFPCISSSMGIEYVEAHTGAAGLMLNRRPINSGSWSADTVGTYNLFPSQADTWGRMVVGGASGQSVHVVVNSQGIGTTPVLFQNGPLTYSRSIDGGTSWNIDHIQLPLSDSVYFKGFKADAYNIDCRGDVVAVVAGSPLTDFALWKSTDNGTTWIKTVIKQFPLPLFDPLTTLLDVNGDGVADTVETGAGDITVSIDTNGICHVAFGRVIVFGDTIIGSQAYYEPLTDGLFYWNETMIAPVVVANTPDLNGNGKIDFPIPTSVGIAFPPVGVYSVSGLLIQPSIGFDDNNDVYLVFAGVNEMADTTIYQCMHRHVWIKRSNDMGQTWGASVDIVPDIVHGGNGEFEEAVYGSLARKVDGYGVSSTAYVVYQKDSAPSYYAYIGGSIFSSQPWWNTDTLTGDCRINDIIAAEATGVPVLSVNQLERRINTVLTIIPNPASHLVTFKFQLEKSETGYLKIADVTGREIVKQQIKNTHPGTNTISTDISKLSKGTYIGDLQFESCSFLSKLIVE